MRNLFGKLNKDERGATAVEYGLIASLIVIAMITALNGVASETTGVWNRVTSKSAEATGG
ncbi:MAG: Flp family type IVb pilin [Novosphingobium sp.]|nr:Flp family type IVb pilin [Novosphingobium sp.]